MSTINIRIYDEEKIRLEYYKGVFGFSNIQDLIRAIMDRSGMASVEDIKRQRMIQRIKPLSDEVGE